MASTEVTNEKRRLLEESERYRRSIGTEFHNVKAATAWVPRTVGIVRAVSPLVALSAPILGLLFRRKKKAEVKAVHNGKSPKGLVGKALLLFEIFRKTKPFWDFHRSRQRAPDHKGSARSVAREK